MGKGVLTIGAVIPTYNRFEYLDEAIKSVLSQTYQCNEILVIDDSLDVQSNIKTWSIVKKYPDVKYIKNTSKVRGASHCRNIGILNSSSDLIAFLDDDDLWDNKKNQLQVSFFENPEVVAVYSLVNYFSENEDLLRKFKSKKNLKSGIIYTDMLVSDCTYGTPTQMIRRSCLIKAGLFDEQLEARQDWDIMIRISQLGRIEFVNHKLLNVRIHSESRLSLNFKNRYKANKKIFLKNIRNVRSLSLRYFMVREFLISQGQELYNSKTNYGLSLLFFITSYLLSPFNFLALKGVVKSVLRLNR